MKQAFLAFLLSLSCLVLVSHGHEGRPFPSHSKKGRIPTNFCEVTTLANLLELQTKVDYERIACEAGQFSTGDCSRYWMLHRDLVRKKLSYKACSDQHNFEFQNWAGTKTVNGTFQDDFFETLALENQRFSELQALLVQQHNDKMALLLDGTTTTRTQLVNLETTQATSERTHASAEALESRNNDSEEEQDTRDLVILNSQEMRATVNSDSAQMRSDGQDDGKSSRDTFASESDATRRHMSLNQQVARSNISFEESTTRTKESQEQNTMRALFKQQSEDIRARTTQEENTTRNFDTAQETTTRNYDTTQETTTRDDVEAKETASRNQVTTEETSTRARNLMQEQDTRANYTQESTNTRAFDLQREQEIRALDTQREEATRALDSSEEQATRNFVLAQHTQTRTLESSSAAAIRTERDTQEGLTVARWHSTTIAANETIVDTSASNKAAVDAVVRAEATATRNLVQSTEATSAQDAKDEGKTTRETLVASNPNGTSITDQSQSTNQFVSQSTGATQQIHSNANTNTQATWNAGMGNIMAAVAAFQVGIPSTLFEAISLHFDLILAHKKSTAFVSSNAGIDMYSSGERFNLLRSTVNNTLTYNSRYGSTSNSRTATTYWNTAEAYRTTGNPPDLRKAVINYAHAYYFAVTP
jgi:hypothetical protein